MNRFWKNLLLLLLLLVCGAGRAWAGGLAWETTRIEQNLKLGQAQTQAVFRFTNPGTVPVRITNTRTSCGCTVAKLSQEVVPPGGKGEVVLTFTVGDRSGHQEKKVFVETDAAGAATVTLELVAEVPVLLTLSQTHLNWQVGGALDAQTVEARLVGDVPVTLTGLVYDPERMQATLEPTAEARCYRVVVQPRQLGTACTSMIYFKAAELPEGVSLPRIYFCAKP